MMASSILLGVEARLAKTDAMLLFTVVAAMGAMARIYLATRRAPAASTSRLEMPAFSGPRWPAACCSRGPLIVMFVGLADRCAGRSSTARWRWFCRLRPMTGLVWLIALVLPWFIADQSRKSGDSFFVEVGRRRHAGQGRRAAQEAHGAPPGFYLLLFWVTFWPGAMLAGLAAPGRVERAAASPARNFCWPGSCRHGSCSSS